MAAPTNPDAYPAVFTMILDRFRDPEATAFTVPYPSKTAAARIRFTYYSFKKALTKAGRIDDLRVAEGVMVRLKENPDGTAGLEFLPRDTVDWALNIEMALMQAQASEGKAQHLPVGESSTAVRGQGVGASAPSAGLPTSDEVVEGFLKGKAPKPNN